MSGDWDWSIDTNIVQRAQMDLAVYSNPHGQIVIRERADWPTEDEDKWILIGRENALTVAKAILNEAGMEILSVCYTTGTVRASSPDALAGETPGARRQRRYRERHGRNAVTQAGRNADDDGDAHGDAQRDGLFAHVVG